MRPPLSHDELAAIEMRGVDEGGQIHQDYKALAAEIDRLTGERAMLDRLHTEAEQHVQELIQRLALTLADQPPTAPGRPTPRLIRDLLEGAASQANRCTEQTRLRNGTTVGCTKQDRHPSPWHRRGTHSWKVVFGDPHAPHIPGGPKANELGNLRILARDWRTALQKIAQQCRTCCTSCDTAEAALAQHPDTPST